MIRLDARGRLVPPYRMSEKTKERRFWQFHDAIEALMARTPSGPPKTVLVSVKTMEVFDDMIARPEWWARKFRKKAWLKQRRKRREKGRARW